MFYNTGHRCTYNTTNNPNPTFIGKICILFFTLISLVQLASLFVTANRFHPSLNIYFLGAIFSCDIVQLVFPSGFEMSFGKLLCCSSFQVTL
jgi:hypothetical protein